MSDEAVERTVQGSYTCRAWSGRRGGRALWALPKQRAHFEIQNERAEVETEDGATLVLELVRRGPSVRSAAGAATLQPDDDAVVRFRGSGTSRIRSGELRVVEAHGLDDWTGWPGARRLAVAGFALEPFAITMHPAQRLACE
jgi:hypothetical protein